MHFVFWSGSTWHGLLEFNVTFESFSGPSIAIFISCVRLISDRRLLSWDISFIWNCIPQTQCWLEGISICWRAYGGLETEYPEFRLLVSLQHLAVEDFWDMPISKSRFSHTSGTCSKWVQAFIYTPSLSTWNINHSYSQSLEPYPTSYPCKIFRAICKTSHNFMSMCIRNSHGRVHNIVCQYTGDPLASHRSCLPMFLFPWKRYFHIFKMETRVDPKWTPLLYTVGEMVQNVNIHWSGLNAWSEKNTYLESKI